MAQSLGAGLRSHGPDKGVLDPSPSVEDEDCADVDVDVSKLSDAEAYLSYWGLDPVPDPPSASGSYSELESEEHDEREKKENYNLLFGDIDDDEQEGELDQLIESLHEEECESHSTEEVAYLEASERKSLGQEDVEHSNSPSLAMQDNPRSDNSGKRKREAGRREGEGKGNGPASSVDVDVISISSDSDEPKFNLEEVMACLGVPPLTREESVSEYYSSSHSSSSSKESSEESEMDSSDSESSDPSSSFDLDAFLRGEKQPEPRGDKVQREREKQKKEDLDLLFGDISDDDDVISISSDPDEVKCSVEEALACWDFPPLSRENSGSDYYSDAETDSKSDSDWKESDDEKEEILLRRRRRRREGYTVETKKNKDNWRFRSMNQIISSSDSRPVIQGSWAHQEEECSTSYDDEDNEDFASRTVRSALAPVVDSQKQTSSVAYLKESESEQLGQENQYQHLPHVMYRPTYFRPEHPHKHRTTSCIKTQLFPTLACVFSSRTEKLNERLDLSQSYRSMSLLFRDYILKASQRHDIWDKIHEAQEERSDLFKAISFRARSVAQLMHFVAENASIILHYAYNSETILDSHTSKSDSNIQIVINCKRSTLGTKEIKKCARCIEVKMKEKAGHEVRMALCSLGLKIDLFISPELRAELSNEEMSALMTVVGEFEKKVAYQIQLWNVNLVHKYLLSLEKRIFKSKPRESFDSTEEDSGSDPGEEEIFDAKSLTLKALIDRVDRVSRKVKSPSTDDIVLNIRREEEGRIAKRLSKALLYVNSSIIALVLADSGSSNLTRKHIFPSFGMFHFLCRSDSRDSFEYEMVQRKTRCQARDGRTFVKTEFYFPRESKAIPKNYRNYVRRRFDDRPAGVTTYTDFFNAEEIQQIEKNVTDLNDEIRGGSLPSTCFHHTMKSNRGITRTKTFFGARYMWTSEQKKDSECERAKGIRVDVPPVPEWIHRMIQQPLEESKLLEKDFMNSAAINYYHDGSEGIQSHFDEDERFDRPVFSLRMFSDSRLSFGTKTQAYLNGAFFVPMPRGCITVMESNGFAANGIKHSVRPYDMTGKSVALMLRHVHAHLLQEAREIQKHEANQDLEESKHVEVHAKATSAVVAISDEVEKDSLPTVDQVATRAAAKDDYLENCLSDLKALELSKSDL